MSLTKIQQNEQSNYVIYIIPEHVDLSKTNYPDGFVVSRISFGDKKDAEKFNDRIKHFLECMLSDAEENILYYLSRNVTKDEIINDMTDGSWTHPYYSYSEEHKSPRAELNFIPENMDLEEAGFAHGIPITDRYFMDSELTASTPEINDIRNEIDSIMTISFKATLSKMIDEQIEKKMMQNKNRSATPSI